MKAKVLNFYIGRNILINILSNIIIMIFLSGIFRFVDQLKKIGQGNYNVINAWIYTILNMIKDIQTFFPMAALLGTLLGIGALTQHNELIVMQASGFTRTQIVHSVMNVAIPLFFLTTAIGELIAPKAEQIAQNYRAQALYGSSSLFSSHENSIWAKDGNNFVHIKHLEKCNKLNGINIYKFNQNYNLQSIIYAKTAKFDVDKKLWHLFQVVTLDLQISEKIVRSDFLSVIWKTNLTPDKLQMASLDPNTFSVSSLFNYVKYLETSGQDFKRFQLSMWKKIFQPLSVIIMMLMALSFSFGPLRNETMGTRLISGIFFGFLFYILNQIIGPLTLTYNVYPILGAFLPSIVFFLISLRLLLKRF